MTYFVSGGTQNLNSVNQFVFLTVHDVMLQEKCIIPKTKSHETLQNRHMFSKFLYYRYVADLD